MIRFLPIWFVKVTGTSMLPSLQPGSFLLVSPLPYWFGKPKVGDVVVITVDKKLFVKRIKEIVDGTYDVRGDNVVESTDSRQFGVITRQNMIAKSLAAVG